MKKYIKNSSGFTIIELIVVIAIIAVLASIVLVNVTQYINKGKDAAIKGNMATLLTNAAVYFDTNPTATGSAYVASTTVATVETAITAAGGTPVHVGSTGTGNQNWCACSPEKVTSTTVYCVDNTGVKKEYLNYACTTACTNVGTYTCL